MRRSIMLGSGMFIVVSMMCIIVIRDYTLFYFALCASWSIFTAAWDYKGNNDNISI